VKAKEVGWKVKGYTGKPLLGALEAVLHLIFFPRATGSYGKFSGRGVTLYNSFYKE
jgi:hypothetical protein